jgi:hypothetical protein
MDSKISSHVPIHAKFDRSPQGSLEEMIPARWWCKIPAFISLQKATIRQLSTDKALGKKDRSLNE